VYSVRSRDQGLGLRVWYVTVLGEGGGERSEVVAPRGVRRGHETLVDERQQQQRLVVRAILGAQLRHYRLQRLGFRI